VTVVSNEHKITFVKIRKTGTGAYFTQRHH